MEKCFRYQCSYVSWFYSPRIDNFYIDIVTVLDRLVTGTFGGRAMKEGLLQRKSNYLHSSISKKITIPTFFFTFIINFFLGGRGRGTQTFLAYPPRQEYNKQSQPRVFRLAKLILCYKITELNFIILFYLWISC